ncbi:LysM peptidoglycan-binding domain-containing protein [Weissella sagaensis]|uniref:LysM peptidoglycan-binding domain-containing protein n=1 Tax=Weissella sagaensis TaxID=2559928 RepID=UPI0013EC371A|nr:LysM peptidoglycan-binding domain-containing protein [Weissella sagaensis]
MHASVKNTLLATAGAAAALAGSSVVASADSITVKSGDTLYALAAANNVSVDDLVSANKIADANLIHVGQKVELPGSSSAQSAAPAKETATKSVSNNGSYTVKAGDSLWAIANANGMTLSELLNANPDLQASSVIYVGDQINFSKSAVAVKPAASQAVSEVNVKATVQQSAATSAANAKAAAESAAAQQSAATSAANAKVAAESAAAQQSAATSAANAKVAAESAAAQSAATSAANAKTVAESAAAESAATSAANAKAAAESAAAQQSAATSAANAKAAAESAAAQQSAATSAANAKAAAESAAAQQSAATSAANAKAAAESAAAQQSAATSAANAKAAAESAAAASQAAAQPQQVAATTTAKPTSVASTNTAGNTYPYGQCTWFVKGDLGWVGNYWGNASAWPASAAAAGHTVNGTASVGAVAYFAPGVGGASGYGHVAVVDSVNGDGTITISESNYAGKLYNTRTISTSSVSGYIHQ